MDCIIDSVAIVSCYYVYIKFKVVCFLEAGHILVVAIALACHLCYLSSWPPQPRPLLLPPFFLLSSLALLCYMNTLLVLRYDRFSHSWSHSW